MGASKALTDKKQQKELLQGFLLGNAPRVMEKTYNFMIDHLEGVETDVLDGDNIPVMDTSGNTMKEMSPANLERMKLAHKIAHKFIDKVVPTINKVEVEETQTMSPEIMEAMKMVMSNKRIEKEKKIEEAEYKVVDVEEATKARNQARSGK